MTMFLIFLATVAVVAAYVKVKLKKDQDGPLDMWTLESTDTTVALVILAVGLVLTFVIGC